MRGRNGEGTERGAIAVIAAIAMVMILAATALSFDIGREVDTNRAVQAIADAVALDSANFVDGSPATSPDPYTTIGGNTYQQAQVVQYEATESALRNNVTTAEMSSDSVTLGSCPSTGSCSGAFTRVETCPLTLSLPTPAGSSGPGAGEACTPVAGADPNTAVNAVRMTASSVTSFVFQPGNATSVRAATAVRSFTGGPTHIPVSAFSIGSTLLDLQNPVVDQLLSTVLGTTSGANLSVLSYNGLVGASVSLGDLLAANVGVGSLYNLLNTSVSPSTLLGYMYNALVAQNTSAATAAAGNLQAGLGVSGSGAQYVGATTAIEPCQLIDLSGGRSACGVTGAALASAAYAQINAANLLTMIVALSSQNHAVGLNISGLGLLDVTLDAVTPMATAGPGPANSPSCPAGMAACPVTASDTQATATITVANINLGIASLSLAIRVTGADATGTLTGLTCGTSPASETATISGGTDAATLSTQFDISLLGAPINDTTNVQVGGATFSHTFDGPFGPGQPAQWSSTNTSPAITIPPPSGLVSTLLSPVTDLLDTVLDPILSPLLSALGINLGYATLVDNYVNCNSAVLAG